MVSSGRTVDASNATCFIICSSNLLLGSEAVRTRQEGLSLQGLLDDNDWRIQIEIHFCHVCGKFCALDLYKTTEYQKEF